MVQRDFVLAKFENLERPKGFYSIPIVPGDLSVVLSTNLASKFSFTHEKPTDSILSLRYLPKKHCSNPTLQFIRIDFEILR